MDDNLIRMLYHVLHPKEKLEQVFAKRQYHHAIIKIHIKHDYALTIGSRVSMIQYHVTLVPFSLHSHVWNQTWWQQRGKAINVGDLTQARR